METDAGAVKTRRSRVSPVREGELFELVLEQLRDVGYELFSVEAVAARAHMSKATIYRLWGGKPELVIRVIQSLERPKVDDIDTGTLTGDLKAYIDRVEARSVRDREMNRAMAQAIRREPRLMRAFREFYVKPGLLALDGMAARSIARGELSADCPALPYLKNLMLGAFAGEDVFGDTLDTAFLHGYVDQVIAPALGL